MNESIQHRLQRRKLLLAALALSDSSSFCHGFCPADAAMMISSSAVSSSQFDRPHQQLNEHQESPLRHKSKRRGRIVLGRENLSNPSKIPCQHIRGGALRPLRASSSSSPADDSLLDDNHNISNAEKWRQRGMTAALASTYFAVMGAKCALPAVLPLLTSPNKGLSFPMSSSSPQSSMAKLLGLSTIAVAMGKVLLGPVIDALGGIRALQIAMAALVGLLTTISLGTQSFNMFAICWIFVDFIFSSCWAGCINAIHQSFPNEQWGKQIGMLAVGARTGNAFAFAIFASVLYALETKMKQPWRVVFGASALVQIIPLSLLTYFGRITLRKGNEEAHEAEDAKSTAASTSDSGDTKSNNHSKSYRKSSLAILAKETKTLEFWLHLVSRSCLMVFASFLLFVPMLMNQVYQASSGFASQTGSIYALGCLLAVSGGSQKYSKLPKNKQALANGLLLGLATLSSLAQLAHVSGIWTMTATISALSLFLWGFAFSIPFYIPPSLYALSKGGKVSSATIADVFDIGGFGLLALFNGYVASIDHSILSSWIPTFQITSACSLVSLISLVLAVLIQK
ncbi:unnamed protein product [Cylindrotheca closterium]|uniref:Uncharacterized protein n=1 Tax=Cylindrotheca closterium TaxID=2856 RepID=A0AAD2FHS4_9STRA|nr:unnamed protein product [Cylindrotheca closterium]